MRGRETRQTLGRPGHVLLVKESGSRLWQIKYRFGGKELVYSIGPYPEVSLAEARIERQRAKDWLRDGKDPTIERRVAKASAGAQQAITFEVVAEEWLEKQDYSADHRTAQRTRLDNELLPDLGALPIADIRPAVVLETLRRIEQRGALEIAAKCRRMTSQIFRYAVQTSRATSDPAALLTGALKTPETRHGATIALTEMPQLFKALAAVPAELNTELAFYWLVLTAARTGEMRFATWGEIHGARWRIPAERMKMKHEHVVPLSTQAQDVLKRAEETRRGPADSALLFPGFTRHSGPMHGLGDAAMKRKWDLHLA